MNLRPREGRWLTHVMGSVSERASTEISSQPPVLWPFCCTRPPPILIPVCVCVCVYLWWWPVINLPRFPVFPFVLMVFWQLSISVLWTLTVVNTSVWTTELALTTVSATKVTPWTKTGRLVRVSGGGLSFCYLPVCIPPPAGVEGVRHTDPALGWFFSLGHCSQPWQCFPNAKHSVVS